MDIVNNTIYFESDEEFEDFSIAPYALVGDRSVNGDYSDLYKQYLAEGKSFIIMDRNSVVYKRKCVSKRVPIMKDSRPSGRDYTVQLTAKNLELWLGMRVPSKFKDTLSELISNNPKITYKQVAKALNISEKRAYEFLKIWQKEGKKTIKLDERIKKDLSERLDGKEISQAVNLKPLGVFSTKGMPCYYTGKRDAQTVFVHLNPGYDADLANKKWDFETKHFDKTSIQGFINDYKDNRNNFGRNDRMRFDQFDVKQAAFLYNWPESRIDFPKDKVIDWKDNTEKELSWLDAKEQVLMDKLQLELVPYASNQFKINNQNKDLLLPFVDTILDEIFRIDRTYIIFGSNLFEGLFEQYNKEITPDTFTDLTEKHSIPLNGLKKKDGSVWTAPLYLKVIKIHYQKKIKIALIASTFPKQGLNNSFEIIRAYGERCYNELKKYLPNGGKKQIPSIIISGLNKIKEEEKN